MHTTRITVSDRRRYADRTKVRWLVIVGAGLFGLIATAVVWVFGDPVSRVDEATVLISTLLVVGLTPILEWVVRFAFARSHTLSDRLGEADQEIARLSAENARLSGALQIEDFGQEAEEFKSLSAPFWTHLDRAFGQYMVAAVSTRIRTLQELVEAAGWPDRTVRPQALVGSHQLTDSSTVDDVLLEFASCVYPQYGFELIPRDVYPTFDVLRRNVRRRIRQWGGRLQSRQSDDVRSWLRTEIGPSQTATVKMAWYLDVAKAIRASVKTPLDDVYYHAVRDAMEAGVSDH